MLGVYGGFTRLPNGLLVTQTKAAKSVTTEYEVLIVLHKPKWPEAVNGAISRLRREVYTLPMLAYLTPKDKSLWLRRLALLRTKLQPSHIRSKRGFFDFGGKILKSVFGVATSEDIKRVGLALTEASRQQNKIVHRVNDLLTIVNRTNNAMQEDRDRINLIDAHVQDVAQELAYLSQQIRNLSEEARYMRLNVVLDRAISQLERQCAILHEQEDMFRTQKLTLEAERLTQDILSESDLSTILQRGVGRDTEPISPLQWYYQYCTVSPIWTNEFLAYRVLLPLVDRSSFTSYYLQAFPQFVPNSTTLTQLVVRNNYAEDVPTGNQVYPYGCLGHNPMVCKNNVQLTQQRSCEKALIQGEKDYYSLCDVRLSKSDELVLPQQVKHNEYVYSTQGETMSKRCVNQVPTEVIVKTGVYLISVEKDCVYESGQWRLFHIRQVEDRVTLTWQLISVPDVELHAILRKQTELFQSHFSRNKQLGHVQVIKLKPLPEENYDVNDVSGSLNAYFSVVDICFLILIIPLYVLFLYKLYVYCMLKKRLAFKTKANMPSTKEESMKFLNINPIPSSTNDKVESLQIPMSEVMAPTKGGMNENECERDEHPL